MEDDEHLDAWKSDGDSIQMNQQKMWYKTASKQTNVLYHIMEPIILVRSFTVTIYYTNHTELLFEKID